MSRRLAALFAVQGLLICSGSVRAQADESFDPYALEVHAFVSQGFLVTSDNNYLAKSSSGSFELTEVGINFTKPLADDLRVGIQLFARDLGPIGNYDAQLDWFYIDYRWAAPLARCGAQLLATADLLGPQHTASRAGLGSRGARIRAQVSGSDRLRLG